MVILRKIVLQYSTQMSRDVIRHLLSSKFLLSLTLYILSRTNLVTGVDNDNI